MQTDIARKYDVTHIAIGFDRTLDRAQVEEMAKLVETEMASSSDLRLLLDLSVTQTIEPTALLSPAGAKASVKSIDPVRRYAVIGAPDLAERAIQLFGHLLPLKSRTFEPGETLAARTWAFADLPSE
jgi:hypothetical protein